MSRKVIATGADFSKWNIIYDYRALAEAIDFAMLRIGGNEGGQYEDSKFHEFYNNLHQHKVKLGAYYMLPKKINAAREAEHILKLIQGYQFEYPIALDYELQEVHDRVENTQQLVNLCDILENNKLYVSIYSNPNFFRNYMLEEKTRAWDKWVAAWSATESDDYKGGMWQYSNKITLPGVSGYVDGDRAFYDYPKLMLDNGLNGFDKELSTCCPNKNCPNRGICFNRLSEEDL